MTYLYPIQEEKLIIPENNECSELYQTQNAAGSTVETSCIKTCIDNVPLKKAQTLI